MTDAEREAKAMQAAAEMRRAIYGDPESDAFTPEHRRCLAAAIDGWYETIEAYGLSYAGLAAVLRDLADDYG